MSGTKIKPPAFKPEHAQFLNKLQQSGRTNMWGAPPYLVAAYPTLTRDEANEIFVYWQENWDEFNKGEMA